jgi:hypothetical protein
LPQDRQLDDDTQYVSVSEEVEVQAVELAR